MTVTKLVIFSKENRVKNYKLYVSRIDKLKANGLHVYGIILSEYILRTVDDTRELKRVILYY